MAETGFLDYTIQIVCRHVKERGECEMTRKETAGGKSNVWEREENAHTDHKPFPQPKSV
jgi:hypothetical protein